MDDEASEADRDADGLGDWAAVYVEHSARLIRLATVLVGPDDAGDLVTEGVRRAVHGRAWGRVSDRGAYLTATVVNEVRQFQRAAGRRRAREDKVYRMVVPRGPELPDVDVRAALDRLSPQQRAVVYLHYWEDLTLTDVAIAMGVGEGTVRKQLARAKTKLAEVLR